MKKILQLNPVVKNGSTGRIVEQIGNIAQKKGWDSYIGYSGRPINTSNSNLIEIPSKYDIYRDAINSRIFDNHGLNCKKATKKFISKINTIKPDVVHLHNIHGYYLNYELLFKYFKSTEIPVIWTLHDFWPITGHCTYFTDVNCEKWKTQCNTCPKLKFYPKSLFFDNSSRNHLVKRKHFTSLNNLTIITVSKWAESLVRKSYLKKYKIKTIYNGVDLNIFGPINYVNKRRKELGLNSKFILLGLATTWGTRKGLDDYIRLSKCLDDNYIIIMIGLSDKQIKQIPKNIIGVKKTENVEELVAYYSMADVVLNLSYQETFGLTSAEGLACGTPGIVYNRTASPEIITDNTGYIVETGNIENLVEAIEKIRMKGKNYFLENCRKRAIDLFNSEDRFVEYINLYTEVIKKA